MYIQQAGYAMYIPGISIMYILRVYVVYRLKYIPGIYVIYTEYNKRILKPDLFACLALAAGLSQ